MKDDKVLIQTSAKSVMATGRAKIDYYIDLANGARRETNGAVGTDQDRALGELCFAVLELVAQRTGARRILLPSVCMDYEAWIDANGKFGFLKSSPLQAKYEGFLEALKPNAPKIKCCPYCGRFFFGRASKRFCTSHCRTRNFYMDPDNAPAVRDYEKKHNANRRKKRRIEKKRREIEQVHRAEQLESARSR
jgi:hypothetical protein